MAFRIPDLAELADAKLVRAEFEKQTLRGKPDLEPGPAVESVRRILADVLHRAVYPPLSQQLTELLNDAYEGHELMEGERPADRDEAAEWDERLATVFEGRLGSELGRHLGQGWLGEALTGPRLDNPEIRKKTAEAAAFQLAKLYAALPATAVDLSEDDIMAAARRRIMNTAAPPPATAPAAGDPMAAVGILASYLRDRNDVGRMPRPDSLMQELELIGDYDEVLTPAALQRSGLDPEIQPHAAAYRLANGPTWAEKLLQAAVERLDEEPPLTPAETPEATPEAPVTAERPKRKRVRRPAADGAAGEAAPAPTPASGAIPRAHLKSISGALQLIAAHAGTSGRELAAALGVSQTTWAKMSNGKEPPMLNRDQITGLTQMIEADRDGLVEAVSRLEKAALA